MTIEEKDTVHEKAPPNEGALQGCSTNCIDTSSQGYDQLVSECAENKSDIWIRNRSIEHAAILFKYIVQSSEKVVYLFSGSLDHAFYKDEELVGKTIKSFLSGDNERVINVVVTGSVDRDATQALKEILTPEESGRFRICELNLPTIDAMEISHFMASDSGALRYEIEHTEEGGVTALASFGHKDFAATWIHMAEKTLSAFSRETKELTAF